MYAYVNGEVLIVYSVQHVEELRAIKHPIAVLIMCSKGSPHHRHEIVLRRRLTIQYHCLQ